MANRVNGGHVLTQTELAIEEAKKNYMEQVWAMTHDQLFSELMRVHTESAKIIQEQEAEILRLIQLLDADAERPH